MPVFDGGDFALLAIVLLAIVVIVLMTMFGWTIVLLGIDLVWLLVVGLLGFLGRVVLGRPWRVEAASATERRQWFVVGFRAAGRQRDDIARRLQHGQNPRPPGGPAVTD